MKIIIDQKSDGYYYKIYDGPDGINQTSGRQITLGSVFEQLIENRIINSLKTP